MSQKTILLEPDICDEKCKKVREMLEETVGRDNIIIVPFDCTVGRNLVDALRIEDTKSPKVIIVTDDIEVQEFAGGEDNAEKRNENKT